MCEPSGCPSRCQISKARTRILSCFSSMTSSLEVVLLNARGDLSIPSRRNFDPLRANGLELGARTLAAIGCALSFCRSKEDSAMTDDKSKVKEDRKLVASKETYEVAAFAKKFGGPPSEAATIIKRYG